MEQGLLAAFDGHLYNWNREVRSQSQGLGIGEDLTRAVARLIMLDWDLKFIAMLEENKLTNYMYKRYVDDTANAMAAISPGTGWGEEEKRMVMLPHLVEEDVEVEPDLRTMREMVRMASSINPMIQMTGDCPSKNNDRRMPLLSEYQSLGGGWSARLRELPQTNGEPIDDVGDVSNACKHETNSANAGGYQD